jgi:hypothetical protein
MECLLRRFMIRDSLLCFASPKRFSLSRRQAWICAFLFLDHCSWPHTQPGGFFFGVCRAQRMSTGEPFDPTFFGAAGLTSERTELPIVARSASLNVKWIMLIARSGSPNIYKVFPWLQVHASRRSSQSGER